MPTIFRKKTLLDFSGLCPLLFGTRAWATSRYPRLWSLIHIFKVQVLSSDSLWNKVRWVKGRAPAEMPWGWQTFSVNGQIVIILGFLDHMVYVETAHNSCHSKLLWVWWWVWLRANKTSFTKIGIRPMLVCWPQFAGPWVRESDMREQKWRVLCEPTWALGHQLRERNSFWIHFCPFAGVP